MRIAGILNLAEGTRFWHLLPQASYYRVSCMTTRLAVYVVYGIYGFCQLLQVFCAFAYHACLSHHFCESQQTVIQPAWSSQINTSGKLLQAVCHTCFYRAVITSPMQQLSFCLQRPLKMKDCLQFSDWLANGHNSSFDTLIVAKTYPEVKSGLCGSKARTRCYTTYCKSAKNIW